MGVLILVKTKGVKFIGSLVVIVLILVVGMIVGAQIQGNDQASRIDSTTIVESFKDIAQLATEKYEFTDVGKHSEDGRKLLGWNVPLTGSSFLVTYSGVVTAGIRDLTQVEVEFQDSAKKVLVKLPSPEVLHAEVDPASIVVYDQSFNPFNPTSVEDVTEFLASETDKSRQRAIDRGILEKAKEQAKTLAVQHVNAILLGSDKTDYEVEATFEADA